MIISRTRLTVLRRLFFLLTLTIMVGVCLQLTGTANAFSEDTPNSLSVNEVTLTGDTISISVTDSGNGDSQTLELNLSDYAESGDEYVTVQATDSAGHTSNSVQFKNPYYNTGNNDYAINADTTDKTTESEGIVPFTPYGTGSVVDNAAESDGKEFFTVESADGNVFYLIIDRQRNTDNVYLLNAVTEQDLASLAKSGNGLPQSAVPEQTSAPVITTPEPTPEPKPPVKDGNAGAVILIILAVIAVGGAGYYIKIVRPKRDADINDGYDDEPEDYGDTEDIDDEEEETEE